MKLLYAESYLNPNYVSAKVHFESDLVINTGIGSAFKESAFKSNSKSLYSFFDLFVGEQTTYKFDHTVVQLNADYEKQSYWFWIFILLVLLLIGTTTVVPIILSI